jgi:hypothetical protein
MKRKEGGKQRGKDFNVHEAKFIVKQIIVALR